MHSEPRGTWFRHLQADGIDLYLDQKLKIKDGVITVRLGGLGPFKRVRVYGVSWY